ncbi:NAD(P)-binding protein [Poronia punctata]|nr:NAD(P)-binding protein [Poronia punctata]
MTAGKKSTKPTILITGLNGYLAGRTAELVLKAGYRVRGTVRTKEAGQRVKDALCRLGYSTKDVDLVVISHLCRHGSLDLAAQGCFAIFHLAFPIGDIWTLPPAEVMRLAVESTENILHTAVKAGNSLQSVVVVSSAAAVFDMPFENRIYTENDWNTTSEDIVREKGDEAGGFHAYLASKTAAEKVFWKFREENKPSFAMTTLLPTYFIGPPLVPWGSPDEIPYSNSDFWKVVAGQEVPGPMMIYGDTIDIRDVARMLLWSALHPEKSDGERFICSSAVGGGQAIADILSKQLPSLKIQHGDPGSGYSSNYKPKHGTGGFDDTKAVLATGEDWIPYEHSVVDMALFLQRYLPHGNGNA